jgi:putative transposase
MMHDTENHLRRSMRLKEYDYSQPGMYYVTIRTKGGECFLGEVVKEVMQLNEVGAIVERCWKEIPLHFPHVTLDVYQSMPNHLHGILVLNKKKNPCKDVLQGSPGDDTPPRDAFVRTRHAVSIRDEAVKNGRAKREFAKPVAGSLPTIVGSFKSAVTKEAHLAGCKDFGWHGRFYDHVVRDGKDLDRIRRYILDNPVDWHNDENFPDNIRMDKIHKQKEDWSPLD